MGVRPLLEAERLRRFRGGRTVVDVERLAVKRGQVLAVLGPNGAGKSTLFRMLLLLEPLAGGRVLLDGVEVRAGDSAYARRVAGVFQQPFLFAGTALQNAEYGLRVRGVARAERRERALRALARLGAESFAAAPVRTLSGGEAQRVALARALALEPDVLLLDEPTANLDAPVRRRFRDDLERVVRSPDRAAILVTHDAADAFALADRVLVLQEGSVVQEGAPEDLVLTPANAFVAAFTGAELILHGRASRMEESLVHVELGAGLSVLAVQAEPIREGAAVHVAYRPEDVVLSVVDGAATSARNRLLLVVRSLTPAGGLVRVKLEGPPTLAALVTRASAEGLGLAPGVRVVAQLKATALRAFPASG